ncbi:MAG: hypothetical protein QGI83_02940, partial [Candidatus Latescibacteria bacterium]|nr:hypothetical protein [Candidatus Latescibacterota bacterium]
MAEDGARSLGVDVARFGEDETVFVRIDGRRAQVADAYRGKDLMKTAGRIVRHVQGVRHFPVGIDDVGLGGGVTDRCREQNVDGIRALNAGERALHSDDFADLGSEMGWNLRTAFEETYRTVTEGAEDSSVGISIPDDPVLIHQLTARKYDYKSSGQIKIESKAGMRARGESSPDRADALAKRLVRAACQKQDVEPGQLTLHQDRGAPMTAKTFSQLLVDLDILA